MNKQKILSQVSNCTAAQLHSNFYIYIYPRTGEVIELAVQPCSRAPPVVSTRAVEQQKIKYTRPRTHEVYKITAQPLNCSSHRRKRLQP